MSTQIEVHVLKHTLPWTLSVRATDSHKGTLPEEGAEPWWLSGVRTHSLMTEEEEGDKGEGERRG